MQASSTGPGFVPRIIGGIFVMVMVVVLFPMVDGLSQKASDTHVGEVMCVREDDGYILGSPDAFTPPTCPANTYPATFNEGGIRDDSLRFPGDFESYNTTPTSYLTIFKVFPLVFLGVGVVGALCFILGGLVGRSDTPTQAEDETTEDLDTIEERRPEKGEVFIESKYHRRRGGAGAHQYNPDVRPYRVDNEGD